MMPMPRELNTVANRFMNMLVTLTAAMALSPIRPAKNVSTVPSRIWPSCSSITGMARAHRAERYGAERDFRHGETDIWIPPVTS